MKDKIYSIISVLPFIILITILMIYWMYTIGYEILWGFIFALAFIIFQDRWMNYWINKKFKEIPKESYY